MRTFSFSAFSLALVLILAGCTASTSNDSSPEAEEAEEAAEVETAEIMEGIAQVVPDSEYGGQTDAEIEAAKPAEVGGALMLRLEKEPNTLGYILDTSDAYTAQIMLLTQETLLERDNDSLDYEPLIANKWEISDDNLTYTFHIDPRAKWSDGTPITSADVEFTFDTILDEKNETADIRGYIKDIEGYEIIDERTIAVKVSRAYFKHLDMIGAGIPIYAKHIYSGGDFNTHPNHRAIFGSGPYVFETWKTNSQIVLKRNENYWDPDGAGYIDRIVFKIIADDDAAFQVVERGDIDNAVVMPEQWVTRVTKPDFQENYRGVKYWARDGYYGGASFICWNMRREPFTDKRVRQALTMLMNRQGFVDTIYHGLAKVVSCSLAWQSPGYDETIEPWPYDVEKAKALLDEAGWVDSDGDGVRDKDGKPFEFEFMLVTGRNETERFVTVYQEELVRAGIDMKIRRLEWASMMQSVVDRDFDATTFSWAIPVDSDPYQLWHSTMTENGSNYPGLVRDDLDQLIEEARLEFNRSKRGDIYKKVHAILHEEQPYTFLWNTNELSVVHRRFDGVKLHPIGLDPREWWVPAAKRMY